MKISNINNTPNRQNFTGAYILKGSGKALRRFDEEMRLQSFVSNKFTNTLTYNLTELYSDTQPYAEILVCTGEHIQNLRKQLTLENILHNEKIKKFAQDFNSWSEEEKIKWRNAISEAVQKIEDKQIQNTAPGEEALANGNPDVFLNWYTNAIKNSNATYKHISNLGYFPFPAKIRRLDADKVTDALITNNFNVKEGFFRNYKNPPKVEIDDEDGVSMRYVNKKLDSVVNYKIIDDPILPEKIKAFKTYHKFGVDKNGKLSTIKKINFDFFREGQF